MSLSNLRKFENLLNSISLKMKIFKEIGIIMVLTEVNENIFNISDFKENTLELLLKLYGEIKFFKKFIIFLGNLVF